MRIQIFSDAHMEWHRDQGKSFIASVASNADVLVIAGDLTTYNLLEDALTKFCSMYPHVIFVLGNHDHYGSSFHQVETIMSDVSSKLSNLHWLENDKVIIDEVTFLGATLWFEETPDSILHSGLLADFAQIRHIAPTVYHKSDESVRFFANNIGKGDIVVTHHLPSYNSIAPKFQGMATNIYFVRPMDAEIVSLQPSLWIHGHTHVPVDYMAGTTRVICNPHGYPVAYDLNTRFKENLIIEV